VDLVDCGEGDETAYVDEHDDPVLNCEHVFVAREEPPV
jgi:hypothetical protein